MNSKHVILITLALALVFVATPVAAAQTYRVYEDMAFSPMSYADQANIWNYQGTVSGAITTGNNYNVQGILVTNDIAPTVVPNYVFGVNTDGTFSIDLIPGNFTLRLIDNNGDVIETVHTTIAAGKRSFTDKPFMGTPLSGA